MLRYLHSVLIFAFVLCVVGEVRSGDWPQFRYDAGRTAASPENLPADLHLQWVRTLPAPKPAFPNEVRLLYDKSYEPVVLGESMFVPSMVTDSVTALDITSGEVIWRFFADGPVRFAPVAWHDKVYFVSDDGHLYCLDAASGNLRWRFRGLPGDEPDRKLLGNGRLISLWPARGGPVLSDGRIYFAAGLWPAYGAFVHALNAETGDLIWSNVDSNQIPAANMDHGISQVAGLTPQGYLAIVGGKLVVPCGAQLPAFLDLETGELDTYCMGWGGRIGLPKGSWFVAGTGNLLSHSGDLYDISQPNEEVFRKPRGDDFKNQLYAGAFLRLQIDPTNQRALGEFQEPVLTPETLFLSGPELVAYDLQSGKMQEFGATKLPAYRQKDQYPDHWEMDFPERWRLASNSRVHIQAGSALVAGGVGRVELLKMRSDGSAPELTWHAEIEGTPHRMLTANERLFVVTLEGRLYAFGREAPAHVARYEADDAKEPQRSRWTENVAQILEQTNVRDGYALVLGLQQGRMVEELLRQSEMFVIAVDKDAETANRLRARLSRAGVYGSRASVLVSDPQTCLLPPYLAQLVLSEDWDSVGSPDDRAFVDRITAPLRPYGGVAVVKANAQQRREIQGNLGDRPHGPVSARETENAILLTRDGPLPGSGNWTHPQADAANTGATEDDFVKAPLELLWFSGSLRWHRKPGSAEVRVADGRVFVKASTLHAVDVYTGRVMWEAQLPFGHTALDQIVVGSDGIYVTGGQTCLVLDPSNGKVARQFELPAELSSNWLNLRIVGQRLIAQSGKYVICLDRQQGDLLWRHECLHARLSIAVGGGKVFCSELVDKRRGQPDTEGKTRALDLRSGKVLWEIASGSKIAYSRSRNRLVTSTGIYRGDDGHMEARSAFVKAHGNQPCDLLSIIDDQVLWGTATSYVTYDMSTAAPVDDTMAWVRRGCTSLRASTNLVTTRYRANCAYIDRESREITPLWNVRPGCNNNLFPANGVLNIPNLTGGCECNYTPTSQAYVPRSVISPSSPAE